MKPLFEASVRMCPDCRSKNLKIFNCSGYISYECNDCGREGDREFWRFLNEEELKIFERQIKIILIYNFMKTLTLKISNPLSLICDQHNQFLGYWAPATNHWE